MPRFIHTILQAWAERRRARRRSANLRAGQRGRPAMTLVSSRRGAAGEGQALAPPRWAVGARPVWLVVAGLCVVLGGGALIAGHARHLAASTASTPQSAANVRAAHAYRSVLPGIAFTVPEQAGIGSSLHPGGALLIVAGMEATAPVRVDLCSQMRGPTDNRLLPLRLGYRFEDVKRWVARNEQADVQIPLRNVLLVADRAGAGAMPEVQIEGRARADFTDPLSEPLQLRWNSKQADTRWLSDASFGQVEQGANGQVALRQQGWLLWGANSALRIERRANAMCPQAGELLVQIFRPATAPAGPALVTAFPARGRAVNAYLAPGQYQVPEAPDGELEDQALFEQLQAQGLIRLGADGAIELAPRDLPQWLAAADGERAAELRNWRHVQPGPAINKLFKRLYYQADGAYVRQQIDIYNSERRLLAWRIKAPEGLALEWSAATVNNAGSGDAPVTVATTSQMPVSASRLFATLPQGWQPWTRVARWPQAGASSGARPTVRLTLELPRAAAGGEVLHLLVAGRIVPGSGAAASAQFTSACTGRACASGGDVQQVALTLLSGARSVQLDVQPLDFNAPEDQRYRHLRVAGGRLIWQPLAQTDNSASRTAAPSQVQLRDRNGTALWSDGAPSEAAVEAGLAPLLGINQEHANSVAGMLARLPACGGSVQASLTLDLPLQALSQRVLECVAMRRGRWEGGHCVGGAPVPEGRHAGIVILDTETGDILAAAGAGTGNVTSANWSEVRDFDRTSPARSPLRLPALQHDGGAHQSPGSTFKVVSALGLEIAAQSDPQIDALLGGMPLPAINRLAAQRGYGFQTDAASYPLNPRLAHITNYREQSLDRRAQEGRLGLAQALTYSLNTWFAWSSELSDRSLFGRPDGGAPDLQALDPDALDSIRPIVAAAHRLGFEQSLRLDGGLLPADFNWRAWDALQATPARMDPIHTRHELRQMAIGLRMQVTPLQMALASAAVGQGRVVAPRMLLSLDGNDSRTAAAAPLGIRLDRIKAGMKGVVDVGTGAGAFRGAALAGVRPGLYGKTGTAPSGEDTATVWFTGWLEAGSLPGQTHRLAMATFVSHSDATGGEHAAPVIAAILSTLAAQNGEQKGK
ncbi:cell division protein FtsI/penicillin-binding protein 2 [Duganella sp. SG902]|uniref:penicillin-binding transpeptidase domain-containing protein n=1 Tax=Duganella sp. SG902 TaxID=2587016 RepID=UPI00159E870F|nr:penicillin-binding transpeptidase domain-containing protein [Duganella sp. SG902]NVM78611.1 cell division protein FtsI/penicillin-binding protein 2 [Duganella sp. SG902]